MSHTDPALPAGEGPWEKTKSPATALVIGLAAGFLSVLFGVGGGIFMVPALVAMLQIRPQRAVGTSLVAVLPTALAGLFTYLENPRLRFDGWVIFELAAGGVIGAVLAAVIMRSPGARQLRRFFGVLVVLTGMVMVFQSSRWIQHGIPLAGGAPPHHWALVLAAGVGGGMLSGLLGIGGGVALVPILVLGMGYPQLLAQGISLAVVLPVALSGALAHRRRGNVIPQLATWLSVGGVLGVIFTGWWVQKLNEHLLHGFFGALLVTVGVTMVAARPVPTERSSGA